MPREQIKLVCPTIGNVKIAEKLAKREEKVERRPQERGERRANSLRLYSLLSPLSCSIAAKRQSGHKDSKRVSSDHVGRFGRGK